MPGKKKGKGNKLSRMSDEERARYLQHRAELELEAKRRKQQLIAIFTKNKLKREEAFSRLNTAKINEQWRFILRQIKCKELYQDVECLWQNFDRMIKAKDEVIERLYNDLEIADLDHRRLQEAHIDIMDTIIGRQKERLEFLRNNYMSEIRDIKSGEMSQLQQLKTTMQQKHSQIQSILYEQDKILEDKLMKVKTQNAVNIYNIVYLKEDALSRLIEQTSIQLEDLWRQLNETIIDYERTTESKRKQYEYLKEQDDAHRLHVAEYIKLHSQLENTIETLKRNLQTLSERREETITTLRIQAECIKERICKLRQELTLSRTLDSSQLKKLSIISSAVLKDLNRITEKGSMLIVLHRMCSSLEPLSLTTKKYFSRDTELIGEPARDDISECFEKMEQFWKLYNYVKADNIAMKKERNKLSSENKQLRCNLRTYLITISRTPVLRPFT